MTARIDLPSLRMLPADRLAWFAGFDLGLVTQAGALHLRSDDFREVLGRAVEPGELGRLVRRHRQGRDEGQRVAALLVELDGLHADGEDEDEDELAIETAVEGGRPPHVGSMLRGRVSVGRSASRTESARSVDETARLGDHHDAEKP